MAGRAPAPPESRAAPFDRLTALSPAEGRFDPVLLGAVALAIGLRLAFVTLMPQDYHALPIDPDAYGRIGLHLATGHGFTLAPGGPPTAMRPPLYPLLLAAACRVGLGSPRAELALQSLLSGGTVVCLYFLALGVAQTRRAARLAALAWAAYLPEVSQAGRLWSEPLSVLLLTAALLLFLRAWLAPRPARFAVVGVVLGLAALARATALPLAVIFAILLLGSRRIMWGQRWRGATVMLAAFLVALTPWLVRNAVVFQAFIPATTHGGFTLYEGNGELAATGFRRNVHPPEAQERFARAMAARGIATNGLSEVELDRLHRAEARRVIVAHPGRYLLLSGLRLARLWLNVGYGEPPSRESAALCVVNLGLLLAAGLGLALRPGAWRRRAVPAVLLILFNTLVYALTIAYARYAFPVVPALMAVAAAAWFGNTKAVSRDTNAPASAASGA